MLDVKFKLVPGHTSERVWMAASPLRTLFWNTTYACNFRCPICFTSSDEPPADELTTREAIRMCEEAHSNGIENIIISGGEPFMREDIVGILSHMAKLGLKARIASNGSLLSDDILKELKNETLTKSFQISLDTLDPDLYRRSHGVSAGTLQDVLNILRRIKAHGFHTTVSTRLTPQTLPTIPQLLDRAVDEGWATVTIHIPLLTGRSKETFPQNADFLTLLEPAFEHFLGLSKRWLIEMFIPWAQYHVLVKRLSKRIKVVYTGCRAGRDRLTVNPCGDISLCVCLDVPEFYLGNIRRDNLSDVFRNSHMCDMMRRPEKYGICKHCPNVLTCGGGCRVAAYAMTGKLDGQDASCPMYTRGARSRGERPNRPRWRYAISGSLLGKRGLVKMSSLWLPLALILQYGPMNDVMAYFIGSVHLIIAVLCWGMACILVNDLSDRKEDHGAGKNRWIYHLSSSAGIFIAALFAGIGLTSISVHGSSGAVISYVAAMAVGFLYSVKPFRFKERGLMGLFAYALSASLAYVLVPWLWFESGLTVFGLPFSAVMLDKWVNLHFHQIVDYQSDLKGGSRTYAVRVGLKRTRRSLQIVALVASLLMVIVLIHMTCFGKPDMMPPMLMIILSAGVVVSAGFYTRILKRRSERLSQLVRELPWTYLGLTYLLFYLLPPIIFAHMAVRAPIMWTFVALSSASLVGQSLYSVQYQYE